MEHSSASHAAGAVVPSTSASAGERGPAQAAGVDGKHAVRPLPELPHMPMNPIPMKVIAGRMIQASYSNMQRVIKDLAHDVPDKRQRGLLDWAMEEHHEMKKLLVLMRCSRKAKDWQKLMNMHGYLDRQSACVEGAGRGLQAMVAHLKQFVE
ncbi:uncharacterized protein EV422DRAFT_151878 [Fimicolochytrium jonesii]|uniref:uncharacterized protein n=1 Tax=Fimicolochytrium jonesii TaxID=1396493 RepID=UPI0022FE91E7|nr:uncharacterized protein EV422DRAFT_151878 [Fimicolochytrium jonesii]KAI8826068.1 hypothetical protein EV422DRAFT_151878 [Fimicolochytrium jonesii]